MKISWNWLNELLPMPIPAEEASILLTDIGLEVEGVYPYESIKGGMQGLIVGQVMTCEKHPDADKLKVTQVDIGQGELLTIVCGAPNVAAGQKVIVATVGTTVYPVQGEPFMIKKAKIRGQESNGMLCAEDEIGLGESHAGLLILPDDTPLGKPVAALFDIYTDKVIEIGLTANHADANSHFGTARELRAAYLIRKGIAIPFASIEQNNISVNTQPRSIEVVVEDTNACPRYSGVLLRNIQVGTSPAWLQHKLRAVGMRPINNVVDITNYILHHYGQPLHAFDADKIKGGMVVVRTMAAGTTFVTLDGKSRSLKDTDLMICDADEAMCMAGVYGGLHSGVTTETTSIFLESAWFNPAFIRRSESAHGLKTDASARFAKGTDIEITVQALQAAVAMLTAHAGAVLEGDIIDVYPTPMAPFAVDLRLSRLRAISSIEIEEDIVRSILGALHIQVSGKTGDTLHTKVPSYKNDVTREIDLIEEILRMYGFNNIPTPKTVRTPYLVSPKPDREKVKMDTVRHLVAQGAYEIATNAISRSKYHQQFLPAMMDKQATLLNSLNVELDCMRMTMAFTGLEVVGYNHSHKQQDLHLFEFGRVYQKSGSGYEEPEMLAIYMSGNAYTETWRIAQRKTDLFDLKNQVDMLMQRMGIKSSWKAMPDDHMFRGIFDQAVIICEGDKELGICGGISKQVLQAFGIKQAVWFAEIRWTALVDSMAARKVTFKEINKFPEVRRDLALVLDPQVEYHAIAAIARQEGKHMLKDVHLFDVFEGEQLGGRKSYAIGLTFSDNTRTLTDSEVDAVMQKLMGRYEKELQAVIRK